MTEFLKLSEAAAIARLNPTTLARFSKEGRGPKITVLGSRNRFIAKHDLEAWLTKRESGK